MIRFIFSKFAFVINMDKLDQETDVTIQKEHNCNNTSENGRSQKYQASNTSMIAHWLRRKDGKEMGWIKFFEVDG